MYYSLTIYIDYSLTIYVQIIRQRFLPLGIIIINIIVPVSTIWSTRGWTADEEYIRRLSTVHLSV